LFISAKLFRILWLEQGGYLSRNEWLDMRESLQKESSTSRVEDFEEEDDDEDWPTGLIGMTEDEYFSWLSRFVQDTLRARRKERRNQEMAKGPPPTLAPLPIPFETSASLTATRLRPPAETLVEGLARLAERFSELDFYDKKVLPSHDLMDLANWIWLNYSPRGESLIEEEQEEMNEALLIMIGKHSKATYCLSLQSVSLWLSNCDSIIRSRRLKVAAAGGSEAIEKKASLTDAFAFASLPPPSRSPARIPENMWTASSPVLRGPTRPFRGATAAAALASPIVPAAGPMRRPKKIVIEPSDRSSESSSDERERRYPSESSSDSDKNSSDEEHDDSPIKNRNAVSTMLFSLQKNRRRKKFGTPAQRAPPTPPTIAPAVIDSPLISPMAKYGDLRIMLTDGEEGEEAKTVGRRLFFGNARPRTSPLNKNTRK